MVIGTTGFSAEENARITQAANAIALVIAPNMAVGVNVVFKLAEMARNEGADQDKWARDALLHRAEY